MKVNYRPIKKMTKMNDRELKKQLKKLNAIRSVPDSGTNTRIVNTIRESRICARK